jgi:hypothetical protein
MIFRYGVSCMQLTHISFAPLCTQPRLVNSACMTHVRLQTFSEVLRFVRTNERTGCDAPDAMRQMRCARCDAPDAMRQMRDARCETPDARRQMRDARCETPDARPVCVNHVCVVEESLRTSFVLDTTAPTHYKPCDLFRIFVHASASVTSARKIKIGVRSLEFHIADLTPQQLRIDQLESTIARLVTRMDTFLDPGSFSALRAHISQLQLEVSSLQTSKDATKVRRRGSPSHAFTPCVDCVGA